MRAECKAECGGDERLRLELIYEGEVTLNNVSHIAVFTHPTPCGVAVSRLPCFYVSLAQVTVLVAPPPRNWPTLGAGRQTLIGGGIVPTCTLSSSDEFQLRPDSHVAAIDN
jgi:hypothetical protein